MPLGAKIGIGSGVGVGKNAFNLVILIALLGVYCFWKSRQNAEENIASDSSSEKIKQVSYEGKGIEGIVNSIFETKTSSSKKEKMTFE